MLIMYKKTSKIQFYHIADKDENNQRIKIIELSAIYSF
jgi:hypothetical protein